MRCCRLYIEQNLKRYEKMTDESIVLLAANNDKIALDYILNKYKNLVRVKARAYFIIGADKEDIIQEGMIGLYKAIRDYQQDRETSFKVFAELCITRQMITAIKSAQRQKHIPLNSYISLNKPIFENSSDKTYIESLTGSKVLNPEELFIGQESKSSIEKHINKSLTELEYKVLELYLQGKNYNEIASLLNKSEKSIDNALQRVKRKLERFLKYNMD